MAELAAQLTAVRLTGSQRVADGADHLTAMAGADLL